MDEHEVGQGEGADPDDGHAEMPRPGGLRAELRDAGPSNRHSDAAARPAPAAAGEERELPAGRAVPRRPAPKLVVRIVGDLTDWERAGGNTTTPRTQAGDDLPGFDATFFDAVPEELRRPASQEGGPVAVSTGRDDNQTYGDFLGEPEPLDLDEEADVRPRPLGVVGAVHATGIGRIDATPLPTPARLAADAAVAADGARSIDGHDAHVVRLRRPQARVAKVVAPGLAIAAVILWVVAMAGSNRPSLNTAGEGNRAATGASSSVVTTSPPSASTVAPRNPVTTGAAAGTPVTVAGSATLDGAVAAPGTSALAATPATTSARTASRSTPVAASRPATTTRHVAPKPAPKPTPTAAPKPKPTPTAAPKPKPTTAPKPTPTTAPPPTVAPVGCASWMKGCS